MVDSDGRLLGFFTDGDLRRLLETRETVRGLLIDEVMTQSPHSISPETFAMEALAYLHKLRVDQLPVVDGELRVVGLLDVQDLLDLRIG